MKRFARIAAFAAIMCVVFSCADDNDFSLRNDDKKPVVTISASVEQSVSTKTEFNDDMTIVWTAGDGISVFDEGTGANYEFRTSEALLKEGGIRADFTHEGSIMEKDYFALYPYNPNASISSNYITTTLPTEQTAVAGNFGQGANLALAYAYWGYSFQFKNLAAMVKISFKTAMEDAHVKKITFRSLDESILLSGDVKINYSVSSRALTDVSLEVTSGVPYVSLVGLSGADLAPETDYYIAVAPAALSSGYVIEFETEEGLVFSRKYEEAANKGTLQRNVISPTGRKNFDNYEASGYYRVRSAESGNHPGTGEYLVVYKMSDGSYKIINEERTDTYIVKGTHFELSGTKMVTDAAYKRQQMEGMVAYVFRNAWRSSSDSGDGVSFANDELILSSSPIGVNVETYKVGNTKYYYSNITLYNRTDNTQITLTLDGLSCSLGDSDAGTISGKFNTKSASTNSGGNPNTCSDLVDALMKHATFSGFDSMVINAAVSALEGTDNAFTGAFTTATHTTKNSIVCKDHFMIKTADLLSGASLSDIWIYKYDTKTYAYYLNNK